MFDSNSMMMILIAVGLALLVPWETVRKIIPSLPEKEPEQAKALRELIEKFGLKVGDKQVISPTPNTGEINPADVHVCALMKVAADKKNQKAVDLLTQFWAELNKVQQDETVIA